MKIEVGKKYRTRDGEEVLIERIDTAHPYGRTHPFRADNCATYREDGGYGMFESTDGCDLVEEIVDERAATEASEGVCVEVVLGADPLLRLMTASDAAVAEQADRYGSTVPRDITAITAIEQAMRGLGSLHQEAVVAWFHARYPVAPF